MDEAAFLPDEEPEAPEPSQAAKTKDTKLTKVETLRAQLKDAIEREDYEKAAKLRDEIRKFEQRQ